MGTVDAVTAAQKRGVDVVAAVFGESTEAGSSGINIESCGLSAREQLGKRLTAIVSDDREVVIGEIGDVAETDGIWTITPAIVLVTKEYIKHDIWGHAMVQALGAERFQRLCDQSQLLTYLIKNR